MPVKVTETYKAADRAAWRSWLEQHHDSKTEIWLVSDDRDNVPTAGLVRFSSDIQNWRDWSRANTKFDYFDYPTNLSGDVITG